MAPYWLKKRALQAVIALPLPRVLERGLAFVDATRRAEGFADMSINGELRVFRAYAPECRVVVDAGANVGDWTAEALRWAAVHAFEPLDGPFAQLARRHPRARCVNAALSDTSGASEIYIDSESLYDKRGGDRKQACETITIDDYAKNEGLARIDYLKIDTEGHDLSVICGASRLIDEGRAPRIQFEYGPPNIHSRVLLLDVFEFFASRPYTIYKIMPRGLEAVPRYDRRLENFRYKNFIALAEGIAPK